MALSDRQNWLLSALVGALIGANGVVWFLLWTDLLARAVGAFMAVAGTAAAVNAVRAVRGGASRPMEWTTLKTVINLAVVVVLTAILVSGLTRLF